MNIEFTTTSLCRPEISKISLESLNSQISINLKDCKVYLNIDPIPNNDKRDEVISLFNNYFGEVEVRNPKNPNFPNAVKWCWKSANSDLIFHYEDDWTFNDSIDIEKMIDIFGEKNTYQVVIRAYLGRYQKPVLSPGLIKKEFYKKISKNLVSTENPEKQLRKCFCVDRQWENCMVRGYGNKVIAEDIGRDWVHKNNLIKPAAKENFIKYTIGNN